MAFVQQSESEKDKGACHTHGDCLARVNCAQISKLASKLAGDRSEAQTNALNKVSLAKGGVMVCNAS